MITHQVRRLAIINEWRSLPGWLMWKAGQGGMRRHATPGQGVPAKRGPCAGRAGGGRRWHPTLPHAGRERPGLPGPGRDVTGQDETGQDRSARAERQQHKKKRVARMSHPLEKRQLPTLPTGVSVPSAWTGLTSLFGMGRGGSPAL